MGKEQPWKGSCARVQRAVEDIDWRRVIRGRVLIARDMNVHTPNWNCHSRQKQNAGLMKKFIDIYDLLVNNNTDFST